jgi:hypothetical protein
MRANPRLNGGIPGEKASERTSAIIRAAPGKTAHAWDAAYVSDKHDVDFNHRINQKLKVKVDTLAKMKGMLIREALTEALERWFEAEARLLGIDV